MSPHYTNIMFFNSNVLQYFLSHLASQGLALGKEGPRQRVGRLVCVFHPDALEPSSVFSRAGVSPSWVHSFWASKGVRLGNLRFIFFKDWSG